MSLLLTAGLAWLVGSNLAIALAAVPFCRVCEAGSWARFFELTRRPTSLHELEVEVPMCSRHHDFATREIRNYERVCVLEERVH